MSTATGTAASASPPPLPDTVDIPPSATSPAPGILRTQASWGRLHFYRKAEVLYQLTAAFTARFLPRRGDRTVDQMLQAARSGKQNIVEGSEDGMTSTEMELRLLNVSRASIHELREDYTDYLRSRSLPVWDRAHPRFDPLLRFCRANNLLDAYSPLFRTASAEELANLALTLCHMIDRMMTSYLKKKEAEFIETGGIKERMTAARLARRTTQNQEIAILRAENTRLRAEIARLRTALSAAQSHSPNPSHPI